ncbi:MAG: hypothetical protein A3J29_22960 [Acidobacteria bacterium RIFCSPLOWO2_12_FULL_67_14b]|nr:MAG: hypothetical protein A3I61_13640 [Acidobacteria bacterium RIFCSPLOWO2_02_FULL_68_18]OFW45372.1 MAG: hypothetical protein A3J29_22960 [Acidobacteria bacterium RIFCSPLOWO2_12_FULL_67_14b]
MPPPVNDPGDERLAEYRNIPDPELVRERGIFIAEGRLVVRRLLGERRFVTRSVMVTEVAGLARTLVALTPASSAAVTLYERSRRIV